MCGLCPLYYIHWRVQGASRLVRRGLKFTFLLIGRACMSKVDWVVEAQRSMGTVHFHLVATQGGDDRQYAHTRMLADAGS